MGHLLCCISSWPSDRMIEVDSFLRIMISSTRWRYEYTCKSRMAEQTCCRNVLFLDFSEKCIFLSDCSFITHMIKLLWRSKARIQRESRAEEWLSVEEAQIIRWEMFIMTSDYRLWSLDESEQSLRRCWDLFSNSRGDICEMTGVFSSGDLFSIKSYQRSVFLTNDSEAEESWIIHINFNWFI